MSALIYSSLFSAAPQAWGFPPDTCAKAGQGAYVLLNDDTWLIDLTSANGRSVLGYGGDFADYVAHQVKHGIGFTLPHYLEHEAADRLADMLGNRIKGWSPDTVGVRFGKSGSDVTTAAVRLARAVTGREWILTFEGMYHGWQDWTIARTEPAWGIPEATFPSTPTTSNWAKVLVSKAWNDPDKFERFLGFGFAAVIFEQPAFDPDPDWYPFLRQWCDDNGALLIADEVVTGLRYAPGGASERYGIQPDLVCMGKALGNGAAVSALIGRREYMEWFAREDPVFWSSTTNGNANDLAAANYVLREWQDNGEQNVAKLWSLGDQLIEGCREALKVIKIANGWSIDGHGARSVFQFPDEVERAFFIHGMRRNGILANRPNFPNLAMSGGQVNVMVAAVNDVVEERAGLSREEVEKMVEGRLPRVLFKGR